KLFKIPAHHLQGRRYPLDKSNLCRSPAQRLNAHRTRSRIQIKKRRILHPGRKYIEKSLAQPVARRPGGQPGGSLDRPPTQRSSNDAHRESAYWNRARTTRTSPTFYNSNMRGWTIPMGRWMGVEMRMHAFFPALAVVCLGLSGSSGWLRGLGLFFVLVSAVVVREIARLIMA